MTPVTRPSSSTASVPQSSSPTVPAQERELPLLAGIGAFVTWCEDLLNILSGPVITAGLAIALVALLTDGDLLVRIPSMLYIWAASMALGLDAQFVGSAAKMARAMRYRRWGAAIGYGILCSALGYVGFIASNVFATQEANGISTAEALSRLGMDSTSWIFQRSILAVILVFLSGFLRYVAPAKDRSLAAEEERARLEREIALEPLRQQLRQQQARGLRGVAAAALGRERSAGGAPSGAIHAVAATLPDAMPPIEHRYNAYKEMHDWEIPDESENDGDLYGTRTLPATRLDRESDTRNGARMPIDSGSLVEEDFPFEDEATDAEDEEGYPPYSAHSRKHGKSAKGRKTQRQRTQELARKNMIKQETRSREREIEHAVHAVMLAVQETGERLSGYQWEDKVNEYLARSGSQTQTTRKTVEKARSRLLAGQAQKMSASLSVDTSADIIEPMEPQELRELVAAQEAW